MTENAQALPLRGQVALVTGGARRVGREIALELAAQGMHIVVHHGHSDQEAAQTATDIEALGVHVLVHKADMRDPAAISGLFEAVRATFGRLDVLVNSAGNFKRNNILSITLDEWHEVMDINLTAPFLCSQHAARLMLETAGGGSIVNILDLSAFHVWKSYPHHTVSKSAMRALTEVLALSLGPNIRVNGVAPGPVLRDEANNPEQWAALGEKLPLKRTGHPRDVARAVAFLAAQPFITGEIIRVDGGEGVL